MAEALIDVDQLQVGMFIHLDLGWMRHPFPLSNFRISSPDQIAVLRKLGLRQVRWSPALSQLEAPPQAAASASADQPADAAATAEQLAKAARRDALDRERAAIAQCEAQYGEAARAMAEIQAEAIRHPPKAGELTKLLCQSLLDKMLTDGDVSLRLLTEAAGDRACAHGLNVALISLLLARATGLDAAALLQLGTGALLHDIGKLEVDPRLRFRSEQFSPAEMTGYQWHVAKGAEMGARMRLDADALAVIAQHHELADGSGFPQRLSGERTHPLARVVALVNRFDGLVNPAVPTVKSLTPHEALSLLFAQGRSRFDATLLNAFIRMMGVYPPGSAVQLTDERYAMVVAVNANRPLKPVVMVYDPKLPAREVLTTNLEEQPSLGIRRSLRPADLPEPVRNFLRPRQRVAYFPMAVVPTSDAPTAGE